VNFADKKFKTALGSRIQAKSDDVKNFKLSISECLFPLAINPKSPSETCNS